MNPRRNTSTRSRKSRSRAQSEPRRETEAERRAREAPRLRHMADLNFFWTDCPNKACHRAKTCAGAEPCLDARWNAMPEPERAWRRDWMEGLYRFKDFKQAHAYACERAQERERVKAEYEARRAGWAAAGVSSS